MKIALTGGTGFVGSWFAAEATQVGHEVTVLGRHPLPPVISLREQQVDYACTDYSTESLAAMLVNYDAIVHLAGNRVTPSWGRDDYLQNVAISYTLLEACRCARLENIVMASSRGVYSSANRLPWGENDPAVPSNSYGASKAAMESLAAYYSQNHGLRCKCLRIAQVLGIGERAGYMLTTFIDRASKRQSLEIFGRGIGRREYVYVKDVAEAILAALAKPGRWGSFNVGTGRATSALELAETINKMFDNTGNIVFRPEADEDVSTNVMNPEKTRRELGWAARWSLEAALQDVRSMYTQQRGTIP